MTHDTKNHIIAYIFGIVTGIAILYLFILVLYRLDSMDRKINDIYAILDVTATCEDLTQ